MTEVPVGFCQCGCGGTTKLAPHNNATRGWMRGRPIRFLAGHNLPRPEPKPRVHRGYVVIPEKRTGNGPHRERREYVLVVERAIGHRLPAGAVIHHVDGNRLNNVPGNLVACHNSGYHNTLHRRLRALRACGNPNWRWCWLCRQWDAPENLVIPTCRHRPVAHRECNRIYERERRRLRELLKAEGRSA